MPRISILKSRLRKARPARPVSGETRGAAFDWSAARDRVRQARAALEMQDSATPDVLAQVWALRATRLAAVPPTEEARELRNLVLLRLGQETYGIDAEYVMDIRPLERLTYVPRVPDWVAGMVNVRGHILSAIDLQRFFVLPRPTGAAAGERVLVTVSVPEMEVGLLVDAVLAVATMPANRVRDAGDTARGLPPEYVEGIATQGDGPGSELIVVLDLPALLCDPRIIVREEIV